MPGWGMLRLLMTATATPAGKCRWRPIGGRSPFRSRSTCSMSEVRTQAQEVFRQVFDDPEIVLRDEMTADDIPGWDSLTHINLMVATEKRFKVKFATAEISRLKEDGQNVGAFLALLDKKLAR